MDRYSKEYYKLAKNWKYDEGSINNYRLLKSNMYNESWKCMFENIRKNKKYKRTENKIKDELKEKKIILPKPKYVFKAFKITPLNKCKVVILGQDPYFNCENDVPLACGLSFSVMNGISIPSSLQNIYKNLIKFGHIKEIPNSGNLHSWAKQGCLMLNSALTTIKGKANEHSEYWSWMTDYIIKYISDNKENVIFVLWGSFAYNKLNLIDDTKHKVIISSHPSGLSCNNKMKGYECFRDTDHFGLINKYLKENNIKTINWNKLN